MSELKQRKKTGLSSAFMSYGLTLIALGAFVLIQTVSFGFSWGILVTLNNLLTIGAFVFKTKEKKTRIYPQFCVNYKSRCKNQS